MADAIHWLPAERLQLLRLLFKTLRWKMDAAQIPPTYAVDRNPDILIRDVWEKERRYIRFIEKNLWQFVTDPTRPSLARRCPYEFAVMDGSGLQGIWSCCSRTYPTVASRSACRPTDFRCARRRNLTLLSNVTVYRAVLLYGDSGTGKSSLINAGFLPRALAENFVADRLRVQPLSGREIKVERMRRTDAKDTPSFLPSTFEADAKSGHDDASNSFELSLDQFRARLEAFRLNKNTTQPHELFVSNEELVRPLLIFDQFEEFVTLFEEAARADTRDARRARPEVSVIQRGILDLLVSLIQDETLPIKIVFSFREDYFAKLSLLFDRCPELLDQAQRLVPPSVKALPQIIRAPFASEALSAHFLRNKEQSGSELKEALAQRIAAELGHRSEGDTVNLTELQIVCQRLWESSNPEELFEKKGIQGILKDYGAEVFSHMPVGLREPAVALLARMLTASDTRNIVEENDLIHRTAQHGDVPVDTFRDALHLLANSQIVRREPRRQIYFYEITSEYLVPWIKERVVERNARELQQKAAEAEKQLEAQRRRSKLLTRLLTGMILLMAALIVLGLFAYRQYRQLAITEKRATKAEELNKSILDALKLANNTDENEALKGIEQVEKLIREGRIPSELKLALLGPARASPNAKVREAALKVLVEAAQNDKSIAPTVVLATETSKGSDQSLSPAQEAQLKSLQAVLPARFYIQIGDESQRGAARQLTDFLKQKTYLVPGIENVGRNAPSQNELRYYRKDEPGMPSATDLVQWLNSLNLGPWKDAYIPGHENSKNIRPGHFELWLGNPR